MLYYCQDCNARFEAPKEGENEVLCLQCPKCKSYRVDGKPADMPRFDGYGQARKFEEKLGALIQEHKICRSNAKDWIVFSRTLISGLAIIATAAGYFFPLTKQEKQAGGSR